MKFMKMLAVIHEVILDGFGLIPSGVPGVAFVFAACDQGVACHFMYCMFRMSEQKKFKSECRDSRFV